MYKLKFLVSGFLVAHQALALWPAPHSMETGNSHLAVDVEKIAYNICSASNQILENAVKRYSELICKEKFSPPLDYNITAIKTSGSFSTLDISVENASSELSIDTDESYSLNISDDGYASLLSKTVYGAIRGLETFSQLVLYNDNHHVIKNAPVSITDKPEFAHRGILLDTSRNYYSISSIKRTLDAMAYTKMNVLHWHIVDSQSWPVESKFDPELQAKGAYSKDMVYSHSDVTDIINYSKNLGIRVIPEFDMPGHTYIVGMNRPDLMSCMDTQPLWDTHAAEPPSGQLNIAKPEALKYAEDIVREYSELFTDNVFNVGGDEVNRKCWTEDQFVIKHLKDNPKETVETLIEKFYKHIYKTIDDVKKTPMCWEETLLHTNFTLPKNSIVQAWIEEESVPKIVDMGYRVVASPYTSSYLDCGHGAWLGNMPKGNSWCDPFKTWMRIYTYDPYVNITDSAKQDLVIGGEVALWSEQADDIVVDKLLWPRAAAAGELYWSGPYQPGTSTPRDLNEASIRIAEHRFRLVARGINAEPTQPLWCIRNPGRCNLPPAAPKSS
ncbi:hypothetical protein BB561_002273 [Smittium simulii]|uniref:Beta-hexosaminidase n=1 Tax=Smittium simulii TaxID=133385 RepID=A0A2T9YR20_9FUNG|nr:hypothetical protein BB561_002273 [Smittium simulii]